MKPEKNAWIKEFPGSIVLCDPDGIILEMNDKGAQSHEEDGGYALIGKNLFDCHPDPARGKLERLMAGRKTNVYTIEKNGVKKLVYQSPWTVEGKYAGFVELVVEIPFELPHFIRS